MPVSSLTLNYHEVLKLHSVLGFLRSHNNPNDNKDTHKVNVEVIPDISDAVVKPQSRHKHHEAASGDCLDMLPFHWRDNA
jgi:hypothetical protein